MTTDTNMTTDSKHVNESIVGSEKGYETGSCLELKFLLHGFESLVAHWMLLLLTGNAIGSNCSCYRSQ